MKIMRFEFYIGLREEFFLVNYWYKLIIEFDFKCVFCYLEIML